MKRTVEAYCPVNAWDCSYYRENCKCSIDEPIEECDEYMSFFYEDYLDGELPYTNEPRTVWDD